MNLGHKIKLITTKKQDEFFRKAVGCMRFTYNWALAEWQRQYQLGLKPNANKLKKEFNAIKEEQFPWIYESPRDANSQPFNNLNNAFKGFFKKTTKFPKFKKKQVNESFYIANDKLSVIGQYVKLPLIGLVKMTEQVRFNGKIMSATISSQGNKWFISFNVQLENYKKERTNNKIVALDFGVKTLLTDNNGNKIESPKPLKKYLKKLAILNRRLSRKVLGSNNRNKARMKVNNLHYKIFCLRNDFTHKLTKQLCRENQTIIIEDLCVKSWAKLFGKSAIDGCVGKIISQLKYKSQIYDNKLIVIDRFYPSSKTCSNCGNIKHDLELKDRIYICEICSCVYDRDINAAKNLYTRGLREINACGHSTSI